MNRIKVIKGWKNPYLPTKTLNYTRDISLWFKVYLLLKLFLNLKQFQLLSFEIRFEQQNKKILYLVINKKKKQKKKSKRKKISLKGIQTPIKKSINGNSIFYLYRNLKSLKEISFWNQNVVHKKILSKFWLTKPKMSTWLNTLEQIQNLRQTSSKNLKFSQKNKRFTPIQHIKVKFYTTKQKQILAQKLRIKKINTVFYAKLFELSQQKKSQLLKKLITNLQNKINKNKIEIEKINKIYAFLLLLNKKASVKKKDPKLILNRFQQKRFSILLKQIKTQFYSLNRIRFLKNKLPIDLLKINHELFPHRSNGNERFLKKELLLTKLFQLNFLIAQLQNQSFAGNQIIKKKEAKTKLFLKLQNILKSKLNKITRKKQFRYRFYQIYLWFLLRLKKKKKEYNF